MTETSPHTPRPDDRLDPRLDDRLDAVDRALHGILPRSARLALLDQIERQLAAAVESSGDAGGESSGDGGRRWTTPAPVAADGPSRTREAASSRITECRPAFFSGIIGLISSSLMIAVPVTYVVATMLLDAWGESAVIGILVAHLGLFTLGGAVASVLGVVGAVSLSMAGPRRTGRGWAAVGLCTGPLPMLIGALLLAAVGYSIQQDQATAVSYSPVSVATPYGTPPVAPPLPPSSAAAPSYGAAPTYSVAPGAQPWPSAPPAPASALYAPPVSPPPTTVTPPAPVAAPVAPPPPATPNSPSPAASAPVASPAPLLTSPPLPMSPAPPAPPAPPTPPAPPSPPPASPSAEATPD